jgi:hypothetical protein
LISRHRDFDVGRGGAGVVWWVWRRRRRRRRARQAFEEYMAGQPKVTGAAASSKQMGASLRDSLVEADTLRSAE